MTEDTRPLTLSERADDDPEADPARVVSGAPAWHTPWPEPRAEPIDWIGLAEPEESGPVEPELTGRRILAQLVVGILAVLVVVTVGGALASRRLAERQAVNDAANTADLLAEAVVQPSLTDALLSGDPAAVKKFEAMVRDRVLNERVVRLKIWSGDGTVLYSDQSELIGKRFPLDAEERDVLVHPRTIAEISDLSNPENALDRQVGNKLVEVYRPVWTPTDQEALFEIYTPYDQVSQRTSELWRGFAGITLTSLLLFLLLVSPILWHLLSRMRRAQAQREELLRRAVDAGATERRRIAASLHDGPVQELAASSFVVAGAAAQAESTGQPRLAQELRTVSATVRTSIRALRTLLVDIYPASLSRAGLPAALADLAQTVATEGLAVVIDPEPEAVAALSPTQERLVYRIAQETVRNAARHAIPCTVTVTLRLEQSGLLPGEDDGVVLDVVDDGPGFDVREVLTDPAHGHFGLRLLADSASDAGASLHVATAPGRGTHWRLFVPPTLDVLEES